MSFGGKLWQLRWYIYELESAGNFTYNREQYLIDEKLFKLISDQESEYSFFYPV